MLDKKTWKEFRDSGLFWWINMILHTFGWAIVMNVDNGEIMNIYPARIKFRGFSEDVNEEGYIKVTKFLKENVDELFKETEA